MKKLNSLPTWILMLLLTVGLLAFGTMRDRGPLTQQGRIDAISQQLACPTCNGESIYVSRAPAAEAIRNEIAREVAAGQSSDDQIVAVIEQSFPGSVLLPRTDGVESLIWILPVVALVGGLCVLALVFRRWKNAAILNASDEDFAIVDAAFLHKNDVTDNENI
ncbi:MAG: cytochrome c-type biogenesis protein CcmH [Actinobacteria bacterium]|jgi:cytochrome c-type biogenesis protein CcmH|nr:cytochrome c-type biogenesis protein CcmH [Actinomycetota bacterium]